VGGRCCRAAAGLLLLPPLLLLLPLPLQLQLLLLLQLLRWQQACAPDSRPRAGPRGAGWMWFRSRSQRADAHVCLPKAETRRLARRMTRKVFEPEGMRHSSTGRHFMVPRLQWVAAIEACRCAEGPAHQLLLAAAGRWLLGSPRPAAPWLCGRAAACRARTTPASASCISQPLSS
jgi:hypothetical protein